MRLLLVALQQRNATQSVQRNATDSVEDDFHSDCREAMLMFTQTMQQQVEERHSFESIQLSYMKMLQMQMTKALAQRARDTQTIRKLRAQVKRLQVRNAEVEEFMEVVSSAIKKKHDYAVQELQGAANAGGVACDTDNATDGCDVD
jgi:hypothetical protein